MSRLVGLTIIVSILGASTVAAHAGEISGIVTEARSQEPVPFASVQIEGTNLGAVADSAGRFVIRHVPAGRHSLLVSSVGYKTLRLTVAVMAASPCALEPSLEATQVEVGGIVVTGTCTPRYIKDVPVFTEVVSRASIEDKAAHDIFEALEGESGVRVEQQCQACNFSILRIQGLSADHAQVLLDGQPVYSGLASVYGLQQMSAADVDRIEIVKGAGSALYGSNAVAGAINIVSSVPRTTTARIGIEIGEHGTNKYDVTASARKGNRGIFIFTQQNEQDEIDETGDINAAGGVDQPDSWTDRVRATSRNAGFNLFLDDVFAADQLVIRGRLLNETRLGGRLTDGQFENPFAPGSERIATDRYSGQAEYHLWLPSRTEVNTSLSFTEHKRDATNDTFLGDYEEAYGTPPPVDLMRPYVADEKLLIANLNVVQPVRGGHRILIGAQFTHNELEEAGMYLDTDSQEPYTSTSFKVADQFGAYLQDEFRLTSKVELVAGLRFDTHTSEDEFRGSGDVLTQGLEPLEYEESTFNPRFSIKYAATDNLILRGSAGTGFRVPYGFSEDLHLCSGSPRVYKGGGLKPERSFSYSITADYTQSTITASMNLYRTELKDAIAFCDAEGPVVDLGYTYQWENAGNAYVMGAEFNCSMALAQRLTLGARFELFEGRYDGPRSDWIDTPYEQISRNIPRYPHPSAGLKIDYSLGQWKLVAVADYKGKMYIDLTEPADPAQIRIHETESFVVFNAKLRRAIGRRHNVYIGVRNLTDYTQKEKHIDDAAFLYAPLYGRIVYTGIQITL